MAKYFTTKELSHSNEAIKRGIDNTPPPHIRSNLMVLMNQLLDPIREAWGKPVYVNSGFRSPTLNKEVGGVATSQHTKGEAADITAGSSAKNKKLFDLILSKGLEFDQLIDENGYKWLHVSYKRGNNRKQVLHIE